eukprot:TRINITY_DN6384_c0_g1_i1.p1 TRINITY_DN6384_c0_g1~~TRINITY_DN6384_c0_g1_i1.p1  ORF type:complete len:3210 (-),score=660.94 TRINITY_DN6384_c0_g1_i1:83-9712(-)
MDSAQQVWTETESPKYGGSSDLRRSNSGSNDEAAQVCSCSVCGRRALVAGAGQAQAGSSGQLVLLSSSSTLGGIGHSRSASLQKLSTLARSSSGLTLAHSGSGFKLASLTTSYTADAPLCAVSDDGWLCVACRAAGKVPPDKTSPKYPRKSPKSPTPGGGLLIPPRGTEALRQSAQRLSTLRSSSFISEDRLGGPRPELSRSAFSGDFGSLTSRSLSQLQLSAEPAVLSPNWDTQLAYWKQELSSIPDATELPLFRTRTAAIPRTFEAGYVHCKLPRLLLQELTALGAANNTSLVITVLALFELLLHRYGTLQHLQKEVDVQQQVGEERGGQVVVVVGIAAAASQFTGAEFFPNTVAIKLEADDSKPFDAVLEQVKLKVTAAKQAQDVPFEQLVAQLGVEPRPEKRSLVQVMFLMDEQTEEGRPKQRLDEWEQRDLAKCDLTLTSYVLTPEDMAVPDCEAAKAAAACAAVPGDLLLTFKYTKDVLYECTVAAMAKNLLVLAQGIVELPQQSIRRLPLLAPDERQRQLVEWNATEKDFYCGGSATSFHSMFEAQAKRTPDAVALEYEGSCMTYRALDEEANELAHFLRDKCGVACGQFVPFMAQRSFEMVVGLYAVLKAGAAYVPLDPEAPADRLTATIGDSKSNLVLLTSSALLPRLPQLQTTLRVLCIADEKPHWAADSATSAAPPRVEFSGNECCYAIFTSGSTGKPKGCVNHHRGVSNHIKWLSDAFGLGSDDCVLQKMPFYFDPSVWDLHWPLSCGARVVLMPPGAHRDPDAVSLLTAQHHITFCVFLPTTLHQFLKASHAATCTSLRLVIVAGEALTTELATSFLVAFGSHCAMHNLYGPTECSVTMTSCLATTATASETGRATMPIGRPISNTKLYLVDRYLQPVPIGCAGEICVGGVGVGCRYLNQPEITAKYFLPDPFGPGTLYRTGDMGKFLPDGTLEYLGRLDFQVKFHGFRIELGEIESVLRKHSLVSQAHVLLHKDTAGREFLSAYVVPVSGASRSSLAGELREHVAHQVPEYMVPATWTFLDLLPINQNGKLDRRALPEPSFCSANVIYPRTEMEEVLVDAYARVLHVGSECFSVTESFFLMGGNSVLAMKLVSQLRKRLHVEIGLRDVLETPVAADLALVLQRRLDSSSGVMPAIAKALGPRPERPAQVPLSFAQQRMWILEHMSPGSTQYSVTWALLAEGVLDADTLRSAVMAVAERHEVLRTTFPDTQEGPYQAILPIDRAGEAVRFSEVLPTCEGETAQRSVERIIASSEFQQPFDLERGPLCRCAICQLGSRSLLVVSVHHIAVDGWSLDVLRRDLAVAYDALATGTAITQEPLLMQYADFAVLQRKWLQGDILQRQLAYWKQELSGVPDATELPLYRSRAAAAPRSFTAGHVHWKLPRALLDRLRMLGKEANATLFVTLLSLFEVLLHRYATLQHMQPDEEGAEHGGDTVVVVGVPVANRDYDGVQDLIGCFVNTVAIKLAADDAQPFAVALEQVRSKVLAAQEMQDVPFESVVDHLGVERRLERQPLVQVAFSMDDDWDCNSRCETMRGVHRLTGWEVEGGTAKFDLTLVASVLCEASPTPAAAACSAAPGDLVLAFEYAADVLEERTVVSMARNLEVLAHGVVDHQQLSIRCLPLLSVEERHCQLAIFNAISTPPPSLQRPLQSLFEEHARRAPDSMAVIYEGVSMTYAELDHSANQLANFLRREFDVAPGSFVPILAVRSLEMVVAVLAVLKAGAAYVPLDPDCPADRLASSLEDTRPTVVVLSSRALLSVIPSCGCPFHTVCLDDDRRCWVRDSTDAPPPTAFTGKEAIYAFFTSGSTGKPKAVVNLHESLVSHILWMQSKFGLGPSDRWLHKTPLFFDASVWEILLPLCAGAGCVIAVPGAHRDPDVLAALIERERVTVAFFVPSLLRQFVAMDGVADKCFTLRTVLTGGEALDKECAQQFCKALPHVALCNLYGPTEASIAVTFFDCTKGALENNGSIPIGKPVANTQIYLLDRNRQLVPSGVAGEICVGGVQLARGYLNRAQLTAERFVQNPFGDGRLYRTGDLGRFRADGNIEFIGRIDFQVKLRGLRIELGEIEAVLRSHALVRQAHVIMREDVPGNKALAAYVVLSAPVPPTSSLVEELRAHLRGKVPGYMVPPTFTFLDTMPLNANGKVDRRALPAPQTLTPREDEEVVPTSALTPEQGVLLDCWKSVLQVPRIGLNTNFFAAGGDSIMALRMVAKARSHGLLPSLQDLFEAQTITSLAQVCARKKAMQATAPQIEQGPVTAAIRTPIQAWFFDCKFPKPNHFNMSVLMPMSSCITLEQAQRLVDALVEHHETLSLRYPSNVEQVYCECGGVDVGNTQVEGTYEFVSNLMAARMEQLEESLDLQLGPVMAAELFSGSSLHEPLLFIVAHHLVVDMFSWRILYEDTQTLQQQLEKGECLTLPRKTSSFAAWGKGLIRYLPEAEKQWNYWLSTAAMQRELCLPVDHDSDVWAGVGTQCGMLDEQDTNALLTKVHAVYHTQINDVLLAAMMLGLQSWGELSDMVVHLEGFGREEHFVNVDVSRTIGWFTTIFPVHLQLPAKDAAASRAHFLGEAIKAVKEQLRAVPDKGIGYGVLRYLSGAPNAEILSRSDHPNVAFNYLGGLDDTGVADRLLRPGREQGAPPCDFAPENVLPDILNFEPAVVAGQLQFTITFHRRYYTDETIANLVDAYRSSLVELVHHCLDPGVGCYTISDFPLCHAPQSYFNSLGNKDDIEEIYSISSFQAEVIYHDMRACDRAYNTQIAFLYEGALNVPMLRHAWELTVQNHASLRSSFAFLAEEGLSTSECVQIAHRGAALDWREKDLGCCTPADGYARVCAYMAADQKERYDLDLPRLLRIHALRLGPDRHVLLLSIHHAIIDGWSYAIVMREVHMTYFALAGGASLPPEVACAAAADRSEVAALKRMLQERDPAPDAAFWAAYLFGYNFPALPGGSPDPQDPHRSTRRLSEQNVQFGTELTARLQACARAHGVTANAVLQLAYGVLIAREPTAVGDAVFGVMTSGRPEELSLEHAVGAFVNYVPVRVRIAATPTVGAALRAIHHHLAVDTVRHQHGSPAYGCGDGHGFDLFRCLFVYENYPDAAAWAGGSAVHGLRLEHYAERDVTHYALEFNVQAIAGAEEDFDLTAVYDVDTVYTDAQALALLHSYTALLWRLINADADALLVHLAQPEEGELGLPAKSEEDF